VSRILVVEDSEMNRDMIVRRLQRSGYEVVAALDGREAVAVARAGEVDLILMDLSLPELDGWETSRLLKADEATRHLPIIALTAHVMPGDRERALAAGCDEFETKPIEFGRLRAKIEALLA